MTFPGWCVHRADVVRHDLRAAEEAMLRRRIVLEHRADVARSYEAVEASTQPRQAPRMCSICGHRWAQDRDLCRTCSKGAHESQSLNVAISHRRPRLDELESCPE